MSLLPIYGADIITWRYTKESAVNTALEDGKSVLLVYGRNTCYNTKAVRQFLSGEELRPLVSSSYVVWYCDADKYPRSTDEASVYLKGLSKFTYPVVCVFSPKKPARYYGRTQGLRTVEQLRKTLTQYAAVANDIVGKTDGVAVYMAAGRLIIKNAKIGGTVWVYGMDGTLADKFTVTETETCRDCTGYPEGVLAVCGTEWSRKILK